MCGIAGGVGKGMKQHIDSNLKLLRNRGPDSEKSLLLGENFLFAASRLAMTDPHPRSNQPMQDFKSKNCIVFNGEIYNFKDLRKQLILDGINFVTESDTEVILKSLQYRGLESIKHFEGMFSFAFYDSKKNTLLLSRDYLGKKPLYYSFTKDYFIFASQVDVIKNYLNNLSLDYESVSAYLRVGYVVSPKTMYREISSVQPGELIEIDLKDLKIISQEYFIPHIITEPANLDIRNALHIALSERVEGHDNIALSMSGGIDSTIIAIESANLGLNCSTYTMKWSDSDKTTYNRDFKAAQLISKKLGLDFNPVEMPSIKTLSDQIHRYVSAIGEPNSNPNGISMMALYSQIALDGHRLVLTGDGADEIFGGYERYSLINRSRNLPSLNNRFINKMLGLGDTKCKIVTNLALACASTETWEYWLRWHEISTTKYLRKHYKDYNFKHFQLSDDALAMALRRQGSKVGPVMFRDLKTWLSMESNVKLDRISMRFSIEARSPFQSEKLIGVGYKEMAASNFNLLNKRTLTRNYPELLSLPILENKNGFLSPLGHWLRNSNNLILEHMEYLGSNFSFDKQELLKISKSPMENDYKNFRFLWSLIILAAWHSSENSN